nr:reverse transcriptase domain-containing protein [Tanacetum cinerariifolium]
MADQRTMAELLRAPTEGYAEEIVIQRSPPCCPHLGFTELHQLDTFYNALNPADQDSLNSVAGGNLLERRTQYVLTIIKNKSKVCNSRNKSIVSQVKSSDANSFFSEIAKHTHAVNQQTSAVTTAMTDILKQFQAIPPPASVKAIEKICVTCGGAHPYYQCLAASGNTFPKLRDNIQGYVAAATVNYNQGNSCYRPPGARHLPSNTIAKPKGELKAITTRSGIVLDGPSVPIPPLFINPEEDERVEETLMDQDLADYIIKVPPPLVQKSKPPLKETLLCIKGFLFTLISLILQGCSSKSSKKKMKSKSTNFGKCLPELISTRMTLELANRAICTPAGIARDVFVPVGKFTFPVDFVIVDYESDPRVFLILGRPFVRISRALIDVHGEEMILRDESINMISIFNDSSEGFLENSFARNHQNDNPTPDHVLKSLSPPPIPVDDNDSFLEKSDTSISYSNISLPEFETFIYHTEETNSGSTTTHADYSLPKYDSFLFEIKPDQGELTTVVMKDNLEEPRVHVPNVLTTHPTLMLDSDFIPSDNSVPEYEIFYFDIKEKNSGSTIIHADISLLDLECFNFKPDLGELTCIVDSGIRENVLSATNVNLPPKEDHSSLFTYVVWIFLFFLTYPVVPPNLLSFGNEDAIFDSGISNYHFPSFLSDVSHRCKTFMKFNVYPKLLNESPMEILSSPCSLMEQ